MEKKKNEALKVKKPEQKPIDILTTSDTQKGVYSNVALIHHTEQEFIIDFLLKIGADAQMVSRVILSPSHMNALSSAINENLMKFNEKAKTKKK